MKKIASMLMMAVMVLVLASCGGNSPKDVVEKYKAGSELTEADYNVAFDYVVDVAKDMKDVIKKAKDNPMEAYAEAEKVQKKYEYANEMIEIMGSAPKEFQEEKKAELLKALGMDESDVEALIKGM